MWIISWGESSADTELNLTLELTGLAKDLNNVDGKFRVAKNEWDNSIEVEMEAATFLKYDEKDFEKILNYIAL